MALNCELCLEFDFAVAVGVVLDLDLDLDCDLEGDRDRDWDLDVVSEGGLESGLKLIRVPRVECLARSAGFEWRKTRSTSF